MKKIFGARAAGKTHKLVQMSIETGAVIVCPTYAHKKHIMSIATKLVNPKDFPEPLTLQDILDGKNHGRKQGKGFLIDDADTILQLLCGYEKIFAISMQAGDVETLEIPENVMARMLYGDWTIKPEDRNKKK